MFLQLGIVMIILLLQRAADLKEKSPKMDRDITEFRRCLGKIEKFLLSIPSLTIYPYCPHLEKFNGKTKNCIIVFHVTFLKPTWLFILGGSPFVIITKWI